MAAETRRPSREEIQDGIIARPSWWWGEWSCEGLMAGIAALAMCVHVAAGIQSRASFGASMTGTVEIVSYYGMVIVAFAPWAFGQWAREHIAVDMLASVLGLRARG